MENGIKKVDVSDDVSMFLISKKHESVIKFLNKIKEFCEQNPDAKISLDDITIICKGKEPTLDEKIDQFLKNGSYQNELFDSAYVGDFQKVKFKEGIFAQMKAVRPYKETYNYNIYYQALGNKYYKSKDWKEAYNYFNEIPCISSKMKAAECALNFDSKKTKEIYEKLKDGSNEAKFQLAKLLFNDRSHALFMELCDANYKKYECLMIRARIYKYVYCHDAQLNFLAAAYQVKKSKELQIEIVKLAVTLGRTEVFEKHLNVFTEE